MQNQLILKANASELRLAGFSWETQRRPMTLEDLFKIQKQSKPASVKTDDKEDSESKAKLEDEELPKQESKSKQD